jgi:hypothetical protein
MLKQLIFGADFPPKQYLIYTLLPKILYGTRDEKKCKANYSSSSLPPELRDKLLFNIICCVPMDEIASYYYPKDRILLANYLSQSPMGSLLDRK